MPLLNKQLPPPKESYQTIYNPFRPDIGIFDFAMPSDIPFSSLLNVNKATGNDLYKPTKPKWPPVFSKGFFIPKEIRFAKK
ncbi:MAG: hypothetical protein DRJ05_03020 [Bacteroidetes bacterium]|nr:MAG: hypothetical protein DRJ05_03020 [Bacteroidota bacterium]